MASEARAVATERRYTGFVSARATDTPINRPFLVYSTESHAERLLKKWGGYCQAMFRDLLEAAPKELAELVGSNKVRVSRLTYAAEILGDAKDSALVKAALLPLLGHASAIVREGAIIGLASHMDDDVRAALARVAQADGSETIRLSASETLQD